MEQDLFEFVPSEITFNILSRLPVRAIATSKCVCKPWLNLLSTDDFINSHLSKSVPALAALMGKEWNSLWCKVFEFDEADDDDDVDRRYIPLTKFDFPHQRDLVGATDGMLLLLAEPQTPQTPQTLHICNPITREYVELSCPIEKLYITDLEPTYGFGSSKITGQHKAVRIIPNPDSVGKCRVNVYTLETGSWRSFEATATAFREYDMSYGAFLNGNLHWIGSDSIICFDLETECFSMLSAPLEETIYSMNICALNDYLCVCSCQPFENYEFGFDIWLMKEYGDEKSWTKDYVIGIHSGFPIDIYDDHLCPIKVFKNGDILISGGYRGDRGYALLHYTNRTQTAQKIGMLQVQHGGGFLYSLLLTPSFLSLKRNLGMENVISF